MERPECPCASTDPGFIHALKEVQAILVGPEINDLSLVDPVPIKSHGRPLEFGESALGQYRHLTAAERRVEKHVSIPVCWPEDEIATLDIVALVAQSVDDVVLSSGDDLRFV